MESEEPAEPFPIEKLNRIGNTWGCHTCGTKDPGTPSGNWYPDRQPPDAMMVHFVDREQQILPHCINCKATQGIWIARWLLEGNGNTRRDPCARFAPPHSLVLIADVLTVDAIPELPSETRIAATSSCIAVGCEAELDGDTHIAIGEDDLIGPSPIPYFECVLDTPNKKVSVWTTELEKFLEAKVRTTRTRVRIWRNRPGFPDDIAIALSAAD